MDIDTQPHIHTYIHVHRQTYKPLYYPIPATLGLCIEFQVSWVYMVRPCVKIEDGFCPHAVSTSLAFMDLTPSRSHSSRSVEHALGFP